MNFVPLNSTESMQLKQDILPMFLEYAAQVATITNKINEKDRIIEQAERNIIAADLKFASGQQKIASGQQKIAIAQQMHQDADDKQAVILTTIFYRIFYGAKSTVPADQIKPLFSSYVKNVISFEEQKNCFKLHSIDSIITYLTSHQTEIKTCDFRAFKGEICDVTKLCDYLKNKPSIIGIAFSKEVPASVSDSVNAVKSTRKLIVQYS